MELVISGLAWGAGILLYGAMKNDRITEREWFAASMVVGFAIVNGVLL